MSEMNIKYRIIFDGYERKPQKTLSMIEKEFDIEGRIESYNPDGVPA